MSGLWNNWVRRLRARSQIDQQSHERDRFPRLWTKGWKDIKIYLIKIPGPYNCPETSPELQSGKIFKLAARFRLYAASPRCKFPCQQILPAIHTAFNISVPFSHPNSRYDLVATNMHYSNKNVK